MAYSVPDVECSSDFAVFDDSSIPPPLSLSAPELGGCEPWLTPPLRNAVSSTELLHEQAMARFYQAVAEEEAEKARERKVMEPPVIATESAEFSMKVHARTLDLAPNQELRWHRRKQTTLEDSRGSSEAATHGVGASPQPEINLKSTFGRQQPVRLFTEEEEEEMEELERIGRKGVTEADDSGGHSILNREEKEKKALCEEKQVKKKEYGMKIGEEAEEEPELEILREFYENEELEEEESLEEESSEFDEEEDLYKSMEGEESTHTSSSTDKRQIETFAEQEDDTYHPSSMVPRSGASERQHFTHASDALQSILKHNIKFQEDWEDTMHREHELPLQALERSPPRSFREILPKESKPSFISDRHSRAMSPVELQPLQRPQPVAQEADIRRKEYVRIEDDKVSMPAETASSVAKSVLWKDESRILSPKANRDVAAAVVSTTESAVNTVTPDVLTAEAVKQKRMLISKSSVEEDTEASRVVADYYGDIIRDHARPKKTVRQYLNTAEMKAAASVSKPDTVAPQTPERGPQEEPELVDEIKPVTTEQSAYSRYTSSVQRPRTPRTKSRTPEVALIRHSSKTSSREPSTERVCAEMSQQRPDLAHGFCPKVPAEELRAGTKKLDEHLQVTNKRWRSVFSYLADVAMFLVACWLYAFKDERLAVPFLVLMVYRQLHKAIKRKLPKLPQLPWKRSS